MGLHGGPSNLRTGTSELHTAAKWLRSVASMLRSRTTSLINLAELQRKAASEVVDLQSRPFADMVGIIPTRALRMSTVIEKISVALPRQMVAEVKGAVETGEYASSSEVIRDALRDWALKRNLQKQGVEQLRQLWQEARQDTRPGVPADDVLDRLERKYQALADAAGRK